MNLFSNIFDQFTGKQAQSQVPISTPQAPRTSSYVAPNVPIRNTTGFDPRYENTVDETKTPFFKAVQGAANIYTGVQKRLKETAQGDISALNKPIEEKQKSFVSDMLKKGYSKESIFQALDTLKERGEFDVTPGIATSIVGGVGDRMGKIQQTTERLSQIENPIARTAAGFMPYAGQTVASVTQPIASALEPYVSPVVKAIVEKTGQTQNIQDLSNQWSQFEKTNPILAENIAGALNVAQLAPVPFAKPIGNAIEQGAKATGRAIVRGAEAISPTATNIIKTTGGVVVTPFKSIYNTAKKYTGSPEEISGIQSAIKPKQKVKNGVVQRNQKQIDNEIQLTNGIIRNKGVKPTDLETYATAQKDILKEIGGEIERLTGQSLDIDITPSSGKLRQLANSKEVQLLDPAESQKLLRIADDLDANPRMSLADAEAMNQYINDVLRSTTSTASEAYKRGLQILVQDLRDSLDNAISNIPGEFKDLKRAYGAVRNVYGDTIARQIVFNRQNMGGLIDSFGAIEGFGNIASGAGKIVTGKIGEGVVDIGKGITQNAVGRFIKSKNDPNNIIKAIFEKSGNKSNIPDIKKKPQLLLAPPTGKATGAKNVRVNQPMEKSPITNEGQVGNRPGTKATIKTPESVKLAKEQERLKSVIQVERDLNSALLSKNFGNKPQQSREFIDRAMNDGKLTRDESIGIIEKIYENADGFNKKHYAKLLDDLYSNKPILEITPKKIIPEKPTPKVEKPVESWDDLLNEKQPVAKPEGLKTTIKLNANNPIRAEYLRTNPKGMYENIRNVLSDNRYSKETVDKLIAEFKEKTGVDLNVDFEPKFDADGNVIRTIITPKKPIVKPNTIKNESKGVTPKPKTEGVKPSPQVKPVEKTVKPKNLTPKKQSATMGDMETKKLIEEAKGFSIEPILKEFNEKSRYFKNSGIKVKSLKLDGNIDNVVRNGKKLKEGWSYVEQKTLGKTEKTQGWYIEEPLNPIGGGKTITAIRADGVGIRVSLPDGYKSIEGTVVRDFVMNVIDRNPFIDTKIKNVAIKKISPQMVDDAKIPYKIKENTQKIVKPVEKTSATQANGPRVIGKMGKVETNTTLQSPTSYEEGMRRPFTMGNNKPIVKRASNVDSGILNKIKGKEITLYRGTKEGSDYSGVGGQWHGAGKYYTDSKAEASLYGPSVKEYKVKLNNPFDLTSKKDIIDIFGETKGLSDKKIGNSTFGEVSKKRKEIMELITKEKLNIWDGSKPGFKHVEFVYDGKPYTKYNAVPSELDTNYLKEIFTERILKDKYNIDNIPVRVSEAIDPNEFSTIIKRLGYDGIITPNSQLPTGYEYIIFEQPKPLSPQKTVKPLTEGKQSATMGDMETKKLKKPKALRVYDVIKSKNNDITAVPFDDFYSLARVSTKGMTKDKAWGLWMNKMIQKVEKGESVDIEILKKYPLAGSIIKDFLKTRINPFE